MPTCGMGYCGVWGAECQPPCARWAAMGFLGALGSVCPSQLIVCSLCPEHREQGGASKGRLRSVLTAMVGWGAEGWLTARAKLPRPTPPNPGRGRAAGRFLSAQVTCGQACVGTAGLPPRPQLCTPVSRAWESQGAWPWGPSRCHCSEQAPFTPALCSACGGHPAETLFQPQVQSGRDGRF